MAERRFSDKEVSAIIQKATALQLESPDKPAGATLEQIQLAASELGISPELVNQAAQQVDAHKDTGGFQFFGAPLCNRISRIVDSTIAEKDTAELTQAIRSTTGRIGTPKQVGPMFEWSSASEYSMHMAFTPKDGKTYIDIIARFDSYAVLLVIFPMIASMVALVAPSVLLGGVGILLWGLGQLATYLLGRMLFQRIAMKKLAVLIQAADTIAHFVSQKAQGLEPVPISRIGTMSETEVRVSSV